MDGIITARLQVLIPALALAVCLAPTEASAGPLVIEESARITTPDPAFALFGYSMAIDGDYLLASALGPSNEWAAFLFRRQSDGSWRFERKLLSVQSGCCSPGEHVLVGMNEGIAAISEPRGLHFFERTASTWNEVSPPAPPVLGVDIEIQGGTVLADDARNCMWGATAFRRNASGQWSEIGHVTGGPMEGCNRVFAGGDVDISGTTLIAGNGGPFPSIATPILAGIWTGPLGAWTGTILQNPEDLDESFGFPVAIDNETALIAGAVREGSPRSVVYVYRGDSGAWELSARIVTPEQMMMVGLNAVDHLAGKAYVGYLRDSLRAHFAGSVGVFQRNANGSYSQVARLVASDAGPFSHLGYSVKVSGARVASLALGDDAIYVFELPSNFAQPALVQDDFQDGNAANWQPTSGSNFSVVRTALSRVYRQVSPTGGSSFLNDTDWTNQSIQADVRPIALAAGSWFGLVARRVDANNFYYLRLGANNTVQIRRRLNGVYSTLASARLSVAPDRHFRLRLEAVGTRLRGYVAGQRFVQARDTSLARGQAGIAMSAAVADYDNIVVSPNHVITLLADDFSPNDPAAIDPWGPTLGSWSSTFDGLFVQSSTAGDARAVTGVSTGDQIVQARIRPTAIGAGGDPWFGLMVRRRDDANYYFVTVRNSNVIQLRRRVNGVPQILDSAPFTFNLDTWHTLRLEAVGNLLRCYMNGVLLLETIDNTFATGRYGLVMSRTAAQVDDFRAVQP